MVLLRLFRKVRQRLKERKEEQVPLPKREGNKGNAETLAMIERIVAEFEGWERPSTAELMGFGKFAQQTRQHVLAEERWYVRWADRTLSACPLMTAFQRCSRRRASPATSSCGSASRRR